MPTSTKAHTSLEIFDEQITKAYGQAVTHALIQKQPATRRAPFLGVGAMVVSRTIAAQAVDATTDNIKGRPECTTNAYPDKMLDLERILDMLNKNTSVDTQEFQRFINERVISSKEGVAISNITAVTSKPGVLTNLFIVKTGKKIKKIKFVGGPASSQRTLTIANARSATYTLSYAVDKDFSNVLFVRLAPPVSDTLADLKVYESLFVFNQLRKFAAVCVPYPGVRVAEPHGKPTELDSVVLSRTTVEDGRTLKFLRKQFPLEFYFARGSSEKLQNKESIPYVNAFLQDLSRLHFTYNALVSIAAAMMYKEDPDGQGSSESSSHKSTKSSKNGITRTRLDVFISSVREFIRRNLKQPGGQSMDPECLRDVDDVQLFVAAAADVVSQLYVAKADSIKTDPHTATQLKVLSFADPASSEIAEDTLGTHYGHFLALRILANIPVDTVSNETAALEKKLGSPLQLTVRSVTPFSTINEYGEAWMLRVFYSAYHRAFLNIAAWVSPDKHTQPTWMKKYKITTVMPEFRTDFFTDDGDYEGVIPVRLCMDHKIEIAVHTFIKNADGVNTKVLKDRTPAKRKPVSGWT